MSSVNYNSKPPVGNTGNSTQPMNIKPQPHLISQPQLQPQSGSPSPGHFQLSEPRTQTQTLMQPFQAHAQFQAQSTGVVGPIGVPSPVVSSPGSGSAKRVQPKPPSRAPGSAGSNTASPLKTMELAPAPQRKKPRLPEKHIPNRVTALVPESALYTQLVELESRIDAALARKKVDIRESLRHPRTVQKTLRIYIFNTFSKPEEGHTEHPSWTLKIVGRILENGVDPEASGVIPTEKSWYPKFSSFFKRMAIYLDQGLYPNNHVILWESARSPTPHEGFEVKRKGDKEFTAMLRLEMNYMPEKFKLSPSLVEVLGFEVDTRPRIIAALWHYVKVRKLQSPNDPSVFLCDPPLRKVLGEDKMKFSMVPQKISHHLSPPQPIHLEHKIELSGSCPAGTTCYDVLVDVPFQLEEEMKAFLANTEKHKDIDTYDQTITDTIKKIQEHWRRRSFFLGFSQSPAEFINVLIASQSRDLKLAAGNPSHNAEKECQSDFYNQPWLEDAVTHYLNRKTAAGSDPP